jgi:hypothetical protein
VSRHLVLPEQDDVTRRARLLLRDAGVGQKLPTPVDDLVACAGLVVSKDAALDEDHAGYFAVREEYEKALGATPYAALKSALRKAWGLIDLQDSTIYIDRGVSPQKQAFLQLHEVGHKVLPWQRATYLFLDDERTLAPDVAALYEREANRFAAEALFQGDRFTLHSRDLPLELETPLWLADCYGASAHSSIRRFVEVSHRCCSVLIMRSARVGRDGDPSFPVAHAVQSPAFATRFEGLRWPTRLSSNSALAVALLTGRRHARGDGLLLPDRDGRETECAFHTFQNARAAFALVFPLSETMRRSRTKRKRPVIRM